MWIICVAIYIAYNNLSVARHVDLSKFVVEQ